MTGLDAALQGPLGPVLAIAGMAIVTYLCRVGGILLMNRVRLTPMVERALAALPGSIVASTVVPLALKTGPAGIAAVVTAVVVTRLVHNEIAALAAGLAVAAGARAVGF